MNALTKVLTFVLLAISIGMFAYLYSSVEKVIDDRKAIESKETAVIERLKLIREAQIVFNEVNGRYTANWDSLANFIQNGQVPIIERKETIIQKAYGGEEVKVTFDTLGFVSAKERIFKKNFTLSAAENGTFLGYNVKVGDNVIRNMKAYRISVDGNEKQPPFPEEGVIDNLADVAPGTEVTRGKILINYSRYQFNPDVDLSRVGFKPDSDDKLEIFVGKVDKSGLMVQVIEVRDPKPDNPTRKETNEQKARKPLRFGSRTDVSTAGNWE